MCSRARWLIAGALLGWFAAAAGHAAAHAIAGECVIEMPVVRAPYRSL